MKNYRYLSYCFFLLIGCSYSPKELDLVANITIQETRTYIHYQPTSALSEAPWLMIYPGGLVDPAVYGDWASKLADGGIQVVVAKMPYNLAVTAINRGIRIMEQFPEATRWVIAGHSLGGAMACSFIDNHPDAVEGLILLAGYPGESTDLSDWDGPVLSLSAEFDLLATREDILARENLLPEPFLSPSIFSWPADLANKTVYHEIPGGNHAQFGTYGPQEGDGEASISPSEQQQELITWIEVFFSLNGWT